MRGGYIASCPAAGPELRTRHRAGRNVSFLTGGRKAGSGNERATRAASKDTEGTEHLSGHPLCVQSLCPPGGPRGNGRVSRLQTRLGGLRALAAINHNPAARCEIPTWRKIRIGGAGRAVVV